MSNVILFPTKNSFRQQYEGQLPDKILDELLEAYDRVLLLKDEYPEGTFHAQPGSEAEAQRLADEFKAFSLKLLKRILELETELCVIKKT